MIILLGNDRTSEDVAENFSSLMRSFGVNRKNAKAVPKAIFVEQTWVSGSGSKC
jgi:hypothetical protein